MNDLNVIKEAFEQAEIKTFDPKVFVGNDEYSQELCDLMLTFSVFCNDFKDITMFRIAMVENKPANLSNNKKAIGQFFGVQNLIIRLYILKIVELLNVINENEPVLDSPEFMKALRLLPAKRKLCWDNIRQLACSNNSDTSMNAFFKVLNRIRHKTGGHYDITEIQKGYDIFFLKNKDLSEPYLALGDRISNTRFYYADAAAQGYYYKLQKDYGITDFDIQLEKLTEDIANSMWSLLLKFINARSSWQEPLIDDLPTVSDLNF